VSLCISSCIFLVALSHSAFATSEVMSACNNKELLVSTSYTHKEMRFPSKLHLKRPLKYRDPDELGM
jgi:hypothetical protein